MSMFWVKENYFIYKVRTRQHSYSVMHTVVDYHVAKGIYLFPWRYWKALKIIFYLAHGKENMDYILYTFFQYLYRHLYIYIHCIYLDFKKGFIPKHTIPLEKKVLTFYKNLIKYISIVNLLLFKQNKVLKYLTAYLKLSPDSVSFSSQTIFYLHKLYPFIFFILFIIGY